MRPTPIREPSHILHELTYLLCCPVLQAPDGKDTIPGAPGYNTQSQEYYIIHGDTWQ
nr:MAG TPA: hypothetical protein [Caudoviricetes sp.]